MDVQNNPGDYLDSLVFDFTFQISSGQTGLVFPSNQPIVFVKNGASYTSGLNSGFTVQLPKKIILPDDWYVCVSYAKFTSPITTTNLRYVRVLTDLIDPVIIGSSLIGQMRRIDCPNNGAPNVVFQEESYAYEFHKLKFQQLESFTIDMVDQDGDPLPYSDSLGNIFDPTTVTLTFRKIVK